MKAYAKPTSCPSSKDFPKEINNAPIPNFRAKWKAPIPPLAGIIIPKVPTTMR